MFSLRRRQGRVGEMTELVEELATTGGHLIGWRSAWGVLCVETGDEAGARRAYEEEMRHGPAALPRGMFRLTRMALLSELCAMLGDAEGAAALYAALAPYAERNVVVAYCTLLGPVHSYLARLAETFGDAVRAAEHAARALERVREMNAPLLAQELEERYQLAV
jgi:hypothetical protein